MIALPPYAGLLGLELAEHDGAPAVRMPFAERLIGAPGRLHGGALAGMMEMAGLVALTAAAGEGARFKPIGVTVDFLREGQLRETLAAAAIVRLGRRIANLRVVAWQDSPDRPVAAATMTVKVSRREP